MANVDFSDLAELTTPADADKLCVTDDSEASGDKSKYITYANFYKHMLAMSKCHRAEFAYKDADEIYIGAGRYYHSGTSSQLVYWDSQLTLTCSNLAASDWTYIYIDDSAVVSAGTNLLTASEFIDSTTEPSWDASKHGYYNSSDRCIFAVQTDANSDLKKFYHDGNFVMYDAIVKDIEASVADDWEAHTITTLPSFATRACVTTRLNRSDLDAFIYYRVTGSSSTSGHIITRAETGATVQFVQLTMITDSSHQVDLKSSVASSNNTFRVYTDGWYFPVGM